MENITDDIFASFQSDLAVVELVSKLLEKMDLSELSDSSEISEERLGKILTLEGNPTLGEVKRLAMVAKKQVRIEFV